MYPPLADNTTHNPDGSITATTRGHKTKIDPDGTITITNRKTGEVEFHQPGQGK